MRKNLPGWVLPWLFITALIAIHSCETNRGEIIPYVQVDLYLLLYADLADVGIGTTKIIENEGVNGIVLYRESDLVFHAYDRTCTLWPDHNEAVIEDPGFFGVFECPECGSSYLLLYADLADVGIGTTKIIENEGVNGIVLYRESDLVFHAYDRTCTLWPDHNEAVIEDPGFFGVFECPECGSSYLLMNGGEPNDGPAQYPLVRYRTSLRGDVLHISN